MHLQRSTLAAWWRSPGGATRRKPGVVAELPVSSRHTIARSCGQRGHYPRRTNPRNYGCLSNERRLVFSSNKVERLGETTMGFRVAFLLQTGVGLGLVCALFVAANGHASEPPAADV